MWMIPMWRNSTRDSRKEEVETSGTDNLNKTKAPHCRQMRRRRGAFLCFDVNCDAGLEFHGEAAGKDGI